MLHFNYSDVIWPRCEAIKKFETSREFDLLEVLKGTDQEFCDKFGIEKASYARLKKERPYKDEVDKLWVYHPEK